MAAECQRVNANLPVPAFHSVWPEPTARVNLTHFLYKIHTMMKYWANFYSAKNDYIRIGAVCPPSSNSNPLIRFICMLTYSGKWRCAF